MPITPRRRFGWDGSVVTGSTSTVHVLSHTLHYGTGASRESAAYERRRVAHLCLKDHMERRLRSCQILKVDVPYSLRNSAKQLRRPCASMNCTRGCYLRPLVYLGYGEMGVIPSGSPVNTAIARVARSRTWATTP